MAPADENRREYFRVDETVYLSLQAVTPEMAMAGDIDVVYPPSDAGLLIDELHTIDHEQNSQLRAIAEKDRTLAAYLSGLSKKVNLIATFVGQQQWQHQEPTSQVVNIGEGGMAFDASQAFVPHQWLAIQLTFVRTCVTLSLFAQVLDCQPQADQKYYRVSVHFDRLLDHQRQQIARHVIQAQQLLRRQQHECK